MKDIAFLYMSFSAFSSIHKYILAAWLTPASRALGCGPKLPPILTIHVSAFLQFHQQTEEYQCLFHIHILLIESFDVIDVTDLRFPPHHHPMEQEESQESCSNRQR